MKGIFWVMIASALVLSSGTAHGELTSPPGGWPEVSGVMGLETIDGHGWLAVKVDFPDSCALAGMTWYNNDASVVLPTLRIASGVAGGPASLQDAVTVTQLVSGAELAWSECEFEMPIAAQHGGLYVIFECPAGSSYSDPGVGMGIGFTSELTEPRGWLSGDGEDWLALQDGQGLAVIPVLVPYEPGMMVKSMDGAGRSETSTVPEAFYGTAAPNPFNPALTVRFGLPDDADVNVSVYDIRGRRVAVL